MVSRHFLQGFLLCLGRRNLCRGCVPAAGVALRSLSHSWVFLLPLNKNYGTLLCVCTLAIQECLQHSKTAGTRSKAIFLLAVRYYEIENDELPDQHRLAKIRAQIPGNDMALSTYGQN